MFSLNGNGIDGLILFLCVCVGGMTGGGGGGVGGGRV